MADIVYFHTRLPVSGDGTLDITVHVKDVAAASDEDRQFILAAIDKITAFAMWCVPAQAAEVQAKADQAKPVIRAYGGRA